MGTSQQIANMFIHCSWCNEHFSVKVLQHIRVCGVFLYNPFLIRDKNSVKSKLLYSVYSEHVVL